MTIIVFLVDTSASMNQKTYQGTTYIDFARQIIEQFLKFRSRESVASADRYMLMTFDDYPNNVKCGWKEGQRVLAEQLKSLKAKGGSSRLTSALESTLRFLNINRMQFVDTRESYGYGRYPNNSEFAVIISIVDGSSLPQKYDPMANNDEATIPKQKQLGSDLTVESFRWDQRHFSIVLRLPGVSICEEPSTSVSAVPLPDNSVAEALAAQMGGRSYALKFHRSLGACLDSILQRIQMNGVLIRLTHSGAEPKPIEATDQLNENATESNNTEAIVNGTGDDGAWKNVFTLLKCRPGNSSHWPIPEAYWPEHITMRTSLPARIAHPQILFKCEDIEPPDKMILHFDSYELERSPLTQFILSRAPTPTCWPVFLANSGRQLGALGQPFGYLKTSATMQSVGLYVTVYNYPLVYPLLVEANKEKADKEKALWSSPAFKQRFEQYLQTAPFYYHSELKKMLTRQGAQCQFLDDVCTKNRPYRALAFDLTGLITKIRIYGQKEYEATCAKVAKNLQQETNGSSSSNGNIVRVSRARAALGRAHPLNDCANFRPFIGQFRAQIPDIYKDLNVYVTEANPRASLPSAQFKNPFEIPRASLVDQLRKMRINFDQQVQNNSVHILEGGMPGQKIKLQHAEDLHSQPIQRMGAYEDYMKSLSAAGMGPQRPVEVEPQAKPHAFGNPFKIDKKNMSIIDEVGEVNAPSLNDDGQDSLRRKQRHSESAKGGLTAISAMLAANKRQQQRRKPGPLDPQRLAAWKEKRRMRSLSTSDIGSDTESVCSDVSTVSELSSDLAGNLAASAAEVEEGEIEDDEVVELEVEKERQRLKRKRPLTFTIDDDDDDEEEEEDTNSEGFGSVDADLSPLIIEESSDDSNECSLPAVAKSRAKPAPSSLFQPNSIGNGPTTMASLNGNKVLMNGSISSSTIGAKKQPTKRGATELFPTTTGQQQPSSSSFSSMTGTSKRPRLDQQAGSSSSASATAMTAFDAAMRTHQQRQQHQNNNINGNGSGKPPTTNNIKPKSMLTNGGPSRTVSLPREPPNEALLQTQREICQCIRQFTANKLIFKRCATLIQQVADQPLRLQLFELAVREARRLKRTELVEQFRQRNGREECGVLH